MLIDTALALLMAANASSKLTQLVVEVPQGTSAVLELAQVSEKLLELSSGKHVFKL
ncbi:hypothetical protein SN4111_10600 [Ligilactobacillus agilis]|uniref:hypothetical protein n=1 Tax=Ligilactobacillus agilis TaxID=1601 RepID=UPI0014375D44|nr:hypothetical protein [Ligilactobacillus agilis]GET14798.1 hypothetical protein SN4111_10600 [Ligilactobacillus agilis]